MQQYFVQQTVDLDSVFELNEDDSHHIINVMRMSSGDCVRISDNRHVYVGEISIDGHTVTVKIIEALNYSTELPHDITLIMSLIKGSNFDLVIQKATELGVSRIVPYQAERSVVKVTDKFSKKLVRYHKIATEAAEQSERVRTPEICNPIKIDSIDDYLSDQNIILYERQDCDGLINTIDKNASVTIVIGPEGGFSLPEGEQFIEKGFVPVSLGKRILRAETAALNALSVIGSVMDHGVE